MTGEEKGKGESSEEPPTESIFKEVVISVHNIRVSPLKMSMAMALSKTVSALTLSAASFSFVSLLA